MTRSTTHESRSSNRSDGAFAVGLFLLSLAGCRSTATSTIPMSAVSESVVRLDLPLVRQDALFDCGLASISALCQYWGIAMPTEQRTSLARTAAENAGLSGSELRSALEQVGFEVFLFRGTLDRTATGVYAHVDAHRPPLVMLSGDGTNQHYELVLGYDEPRGNLILLDPVMGETLVPVAVFDRNWERCKRFTLLAAPKPPSSVANLDEVKPGTAARHPDHHSN